MKFKQISKLDKRNKNNVKKIDGDIMSANCEVIVVFPIYGQFGAIWKTDSGCMVYKA